MIDLSLNPCFEINIPVRISDVNYGKHLGHASLISIIHQARVKFLKYKCLDEMDIDGVSMIVKRIEVDYLGEAFFDEVLKVRVFIKEIDKASLSFFYLVTKGSDAEKVARVSELILFMNKKGKVSRTPKSIQDIGGR